MANGHACQNELIEEWRVGQQEVRVLEELLLKREWAWLKVHPGQVGMRRLEAVQ